MSFVEKEIINVFALPICKAIDEYWIKKIVKPNKKAKKEMKKLGIRSRG